VSQVDWDDEKVGNKRDNHKFNKDTWNRYVILDQQCEHEWFHYYEGYRMCTSKGTRKDPQGRCAYCSVKNDEPRDRFGANICVYVTNAQMQPLGPMGPKSFFITWWAFNRDRWEQIRMFKRTGGDLRAHDLIFHCTDLKYQKGNLSCAPEAWWLEDPTFKGLVAAQYKLDRVDLAKKLTRYETYEQQLERLSGQNNQQQQGGQPQFNPQAVQSAVAMPQAGAPMFGGSVQPPQGAPDMSLLEGPTDPPTNAPAVETASAVSSPSPAPQQEVSLDAVLPAGSPEVPAEPNTDDLDAMLADMNPS